MGEHGTTIKELADKLGVSKTTVTKYLKELDLQSHRKKVGNRYYLDSFATSAIADAVVRRSEEEPTEEAGEGPEGRELLEDLRGLLSELEGARGELERLQKLTEEQSSLIVSQGHDLKESLDNVQRLTEELSRYRTAYHLMREASLWERARGYPNTLKGLPLPEEASEDSRKSRMAGMISALQRGLRRPDK